MISGVLKRILKSDKRMNDIFEDIIVSDNPKDDLVGFIAYSIFKIREIEFIENYEAKNGKRPTQRAMKQFRLNASGKQNISSYRREANELLNSFINKAIAKKTDDIRNILPERIIVNSESATKLFMYGVWQSVIGSFLFVLLTGILAFFYWSSQRGIGEVVKEIFLIEQSTEKEKLTPNQIRDNFILYDSSETIREELLDSLTKQK